MPDNHEPIEWSDWLYREEKFHTAALQYLLASTAESPCGRTRAIATAQALVDLGRPSGASGQGLEWQVAGVGEPRADHAIPSRRRRRTADRTHKRPSADLAVQLEFAAGPDRWLIIECNVDSSSSRQRLDDLSWAHDHHVLIALGKTALARTQVDLDADADAGFIYDHPVAEEPWEGWHPAALPHKPAVPSRRGQNTTRSWSLLDPGRWSAVLETIGAGNDDGLGGYAAAVAAEASDHRLALAAANNQVTLPADRGPNGERFAYLLSAAWGAELRRHLHGVDVPGPPSRTPDQPARVWNLVHETDVSGSPRLLVFPAEWTGDGVNAYLQLDLPSRTLEVRIGVDRERPGRHAFRDAVAAVASAATDARRPSVSLEPDAGVESSFPAHFEPGAESDAPEWTHKTASVAALSLDAVGSPEGAAREIADLVAELDLRVTTAKFNALEWQPEAQA